MNVKFGVTSHGLSIFADGEEYISRISGYSTYYDAEGDLQVYYSSGDWVADGQTAHCDNMSFEIKAHSNGFLVRSTFKNIGEKFRPRRIICLSGDFKKCIKRGIVNEFFATNGNLLLEMQSPVESVYTVNGKIYLSADNTVFDTMDDESFVWGAATYEKYFSSVSFARGGHITASMDSEATPFGNGDEITSEWFYFAPCDDCVSGLEHFARTVADLAGVAPITAENPSGYCTWYYYFGGIKDSTIRENMAVLEAHKEQLPIKYIQIDDGWFDKAGEWLPNEKFPDIKALADDIKAAGYVPGLWLAPFWCSGRSDIFKEKKEWFVKRENGQPWDGCFDFTNPEFNAYFSEIIHRMTYDWGFRYLKLDAISGNICPGIHYKKGTTAMENYKTGLRTIRAAAHPDTFILGCTAPLAASCGLVDGMRVSCDISGMWLSLKKVFNAVLNRYYYHRNYFLCDADCIMVRKSENEDEECSVPCLRNDDEIKTYITAIAASGGIVMLSDKMPNLAPEQIDLVSKLFPVAQNPARPLDMMDSSIPGVLDFGCKGNNRTVAFINWGEAPAKLSLDIGEGAQLVREFWSGELGTFNGGVFTVELEPHCSKVYSFTPSAAAAVVGSDASVVMQSKWSLAGKTITGERLKAGETVFVAAKSGIKSAVGCTYKQLCEKDSTLFFAVWVDDDKYSIEF